jgi:uncharacterized protein (TIGR00251 family)
VLASVGGPQHSPWTSGPHGLVVDVRLTPRGGRDAIEGIERRADGRVVLKVRVRAAPFESQANAALCRLLAETLDVAPRNVTVAAGATARVKRIQITGEADSLVEKLTRVLKG